MPPACPSSRWTSALALRLSRTGRPVFWLTTSLKQFGPLDEFLKSIVVPAAAVSGNTFRSIPWWRDTNGFTRRFSIWKRRDDNERLNQTMRSPATTSEAIPGSNRWCIHPPSQFRKPASLMIGYFKNRDRVTLLNQSFWHTRQRSFR